MRPIAHARRLSSRAAASRHAVDAVVVGNPVPIGIPALFLADQFSRGRTAEQILSGKRGLIAEYAGAEGYAYRWGHLIELRLGASSCGASFPSPYGSGSRMYAPDRRCSSKSS
jgi:hypothetical protein